MPEEAKKKGAFIGAIIGGIIAGLLSGGGAGLGAAKQSEAEHQAELELREAIFQKYIDEKVIPAFEAQLDEELGALEDELGALGQDIDKCEKAATDADKQAFAALEAVRMRFGQRTVSRAMDSAEEALAAEASRTPSSTSSSSETPLPKPPSSTRSAG